MLQKKPMSRGVYYQVWVAPPKERWEKVFRRATSKSARGRGPFELGSEWWPAIKTAGDGTHRLGNMYCEVIRAAVVSWCRTEVGMMPIIQ